MRLRRFRVLVCVVAVLVFAGCDWAQLGFGPANTSDNPYEPAITSSSVAHLTVAWSQACGCLARPLVVGGVVYDLDDSVSGTTSVRAFDAANGTAKWSRPFAVSPPLSSVRLMAVTNGLVFLIVTRSVVALDSATGATRWSVDPPAPGTGTISLGHLLIDETGFPSGGPQSTAAFVDVTAAIANANPVSEISAIDSAGHILWSTTPGGHSAGFAGVKTNNQPNSTQRTLDVVSALPTPSAYMLSQYDEADGRLLHQVLVGSGAPPPAIPDVVSASNGLVYFVETGGSGGSNPSSGVVATDPTNGTVVWSGPGNLPYAVAPNVLVSVLLSHGTLSTMAGLDSRTGRVLWQGAQSFTSPSDPAIAGSLVFDTHGGVAEVRDLATGKVAGTFSTIDSLASPITPSNGLLYVGSSQRLYALAPSRT